MWQQWYLEQYSNGTAEAAILENTFLLTAVEKEKKSSHYTKLMNTNHYQLYKNKCACGQNLKGKKTP